jgi:hypothetical protein
MITIARSGGQRQEAAFSRATRFDSEHIGAG